MKFINLSLSRKVFRPVAITTTFNNGENEDKQRPIHRNSYKNKKYLNNIIKLNGLFNYESKLLSGEELVSLIDTKFGKIHKTDIIKNTLYITSDIIDIPDMIHFNRLADNINTNKDPTHIKNIIKNSNIIFDEYTNILIQIPI